MCDLALYSYNERAFYGEKKSILGLGKTVAQYIVSSAKLTNLGKQWGLRTTFFETKHEIRFGRHISELIKANTF